jgi:SAM-dependent methyltransferase
LVIPETKKVIFYRRLAILLPPGDPGQIMSAADLDRQGLRIGLFSIHTVGPLVEKIKPNATVISTDQHLLLDLLEQGRLDAVVTWDCFLEIRPNLVTMRLPRSVAGDGASMEVPAFVAKGTERRRDAEAFIDYCAESPEAHRILLSNAVMLQDGSRAEEYDTGAAVKFAKVYENIDRQIVDDYGISKGTCIDVGCGPGQMDLMLAKMTDLKIVGVDIEPEAIDVARKNALDAGLSDRVNFVCADAHSLPFANESADLIISRGTLPFLRDQVLAFREVYRVLKPGGVAFLGGGMGRYTLPEEAEKLYPRGTGPKTAMGLGPGQKPEESMFPFPVGDMNVLMTRAGIPNYKVITEGGRWVEIRK